MSEQPGDGGKRTDGGRLRREKTRSMKSEVIHRGASSMVVGFFFTGTILLSFLVSFEVLGWSFSYEYIYRVFAIFWVSSSITVFLMSLNA